MKIGFILVWCGLSLCFNNISDTHQEMKTNKYLALGDSYTIGENVYLQQRFPMQLVEKLKNKGIEVESPLIIAKTGWTTDELLKGIEEKKPRNDFDLVTLLIGVNNQYRGLDIENYQEEFLVLLKKAIVFAKGDNQNVIVLSIPDYGVTPFGQEKGKDRIAKEIDQFNLVNKKISEQYGVTYVDITAISRKAIADPDLVADDALHPSDIMYELWVQKMMPEVTKILMNE